VKFVLKKSQNLNSSEILKIIKIKSEYWKYNYRSQKAWFKKFVKNNDFHVLLFLNKNLISYAHLIFTNLYTKEKICFLGTHVTSRKFRNQKYGRSLIKYCNKIIASKNILGILKCRNKDIYYYKKCNWILIKSKKHLLKLDKRSTWMCYQ
jgi:predicted GNAT family N-acyltransferase